MVTLNRHKEDIAKMAKGARSEPRWLRRPITASSIIILVGLTMMFAAGKTGQVNLAWAGTSIFAMGTVAWLVAFGRLVVWRVQSAWAIRDSYTMPLGKMFNRSGNRNIDADSE